MLGLYIALPLFAFAAAVPVAQQPSFVGQGTNDLANALLQGHASEEENLVFSPLGTNVLLAIFAEGSRGASKEEIASSLHFPADQQAVRLGYQSVLQRLSGNYKLNSPEMKNWFYIYKNHSVDATLKQVLREYYLTEVKSVDRPEDFLGSDSQKTKVKVPVGLQGKPTDHLIDVDKEVESIIETASSPHKSDGEEAASNQQPTLFDPAKPLDTKVDVMSKPVKDVATENKEVPAKSDVPHADKEKLSEEEQKELKKDVVKDDIISKDKDSDIKKVVEDNVVASSSVMTLAVKELNEDKKSNEEMMMAVQRSIKTAEDMSGMTDSAVKIKGNGTVSHMIVFNGLYFQGDWNTEFVKKQADDAAPFYKANGEKVFVHTLHAEGLFYTVDVPELKSRAVELKYKGGRYSLLLILPHARDGLNQLVSALDEYPISRIFDQLSEKLLNICLPTFQITTISKPMSASQEAGLLKIKSIFSPETADLSGISSQPGLYVEELVQLVTFKVDSNYTEANFLTASIASSRSDVEKVQMNHPFLFYLRDNVDGLIIVNGKVLDPTPTDDDFASMSLRNTVVRNAVE